MTQEEYLDQLKSGTMVDFEVLMALIDDNYHHTAAAFSNGDLENNSDENQGSAKLFCFAAIHQLSVLETLHCFGQYYKDVLNAPNDDNHPNIRNFITYGWAGLKFASPVLKPQ